MKVLLLLLALLLLVVGSVLGYANHAPVSIDLLFVQLEWPLIAALLAAFGIGVLITTLISSIRHWALKHRCRRAEKRLAAVENELNHLRQVSAATPNTPITAEKPIAPVTEIA